MRVEFFGIPRERVGLSEVEVEADNLGQLFAVLATRFPALRELITTRGLDSSIAASLNGDTFVSDPNTSLAADDHVLLISADAGG
jgi:molybdopterin converting factor small subunit